MRHWLKKAPPKILAELSVVCAHWAVASKLLDDERLDGCLVVAVDGTKVEHCRKGHVVNGKERRLALLASILTRWSALPAMVEDEDQCDNDRDKADCELRAVKRLAARLHREFPRTKTCLVGDALYACEAVYAMCEKYGWHFIVTFKDGSAPAQFADAAALIAYSDNGGAYTVRRGSAKRVDGKVRWICGVPATGSREINVVECEEASPQPYHGWFATDLPCGSAEEASALATWGRQRWNIEAGFRSMKRLGFGLGHNFCDHDTASANFHTLMLVGYFLWEIFLKCQYRHRVAGPRKLTGIKIARTIWYGMRRWGFTDPGPGCENLHKPA